MSTSHETTGVTVRQRADGSMTIEIEGKVLGRYKSCTEMAEMFGLLMLRHPREQQSSGRELTVAAAAFQNLATQAMAVRDRILAHGGNPMVEHANNLVARRQPMQHIRAMSEELCALLGTRELCEILEGDLCDE